MTPSDAPMRPDSSISWHAYPALLLAGCFAAGIVIADRWVPDLWVWSGTALGAVLVLAAGYQFQRGRLVSLRPLVRTAAVALVVLAAGAARHSHDLHVPRAHIARLAGESSRPLALTGHVSEQPAASGYGTRLVLDDVAVVASSDTAQVKGRVQVTLRRRSWRAAPDFPAVSAGDVVRVIGVLEALPRRRNPADFDYGTYLRRRGVYAVMTIDRAEDVVVLGHRRGVLATAVEAARRYVRSAFDRRVPSDEGRAVLTALLLGDRSHVDLDVRERFARTGLLHLLAISGLHVLLIGMLLYGCLRPMLLRAGLSWWPAEVTRSVLTMGVLVFYMLLTGTGASVVRAVVMAGLFIGAALAQRPVRSLNTLGVAALVLLAVHPAFLFDVGFQLSFAAVGALASLLPVWQRRLPTWCYDRPPVRGTVVSVLVSLAATLGTMPVLLFHFGYTSFAGLLLNLVAIPLTALTLGGGILALLTAGWPADAFAAAADASTHGLLQVAALGEAWMGWASVKGFVTAPWLLAVGALLLLCLAQWPRPRSRWRLATAALLVAVSGLWMEILVDDHRPKLDVVFFDVGQGDAALVALPGGKHLLIDTGVGNAYTDRGARTVIAHLNRFGIDRLDAVVITHPDSDHLGGLPALLRSGVPVGQVVHSGDRATSALYADVDRLLDSLDTAQRVVRAGDRLDLDHDVRIQVLGPTQPLVNHREANEGSVVLRIQYGHSVFLFTGDAEALAEQHLVDTYGPLLQSDVVKVAHHGSPTSSGPSFVEHVVADHSGSAHSGSTRAIVSVGQRNRFGLPAPDVLARWRQQGATVHATAKEGAVWLRSRGGEVEHVSW